MLKLMWGTFVRNKSKMLIVAVVASLPIMIGFQNCSKTQHFQLTDVSNKAAPIDTDQLPLNEEVVVDENNNIVGGPVDDGGGSSGGSGGSGGSNSPPVEENDGEDMGYQLEDPEQEMEEDINEAVAACDSYLGNESNNSQNGSLSQDGLTLTGIRGNKVITRQDFNGQSRVKSINHAYGKIVVCGLEVESINDSGGRLILVNSRVGVISRHHGQVALEGSSALVDSSNVKIYRNSEN